MHYIFHKQFIKDYEKLPVKIHKAIKERLTLFVENPFSKKLNNHGLEGKYKEYRSINIAGDYRAIYKEVSKEEVVFVKIGTHAELYG